MVARTLSLAQASPLVALEVLGLGGEAQPSLDPELAIRKALASLNGVSLTLDSIGVTARRLMLVLLAQRTPLTAATLAFETAGADPAALAAAWERLELACVVERRADGSVQITKATNAVVSPVGVAYADDRVTKDFIGIVLKAWHEPAVGNKAEQLARLVAVFQSPGATARLARHVSPDALALLRSIGQRFNVGTFDISELGVALHDRHRFTLSRYTQGGRRVPEHAALHELADLGLIGVSEYNGEVWIWHEVWNALGLPIVHDWDVAPMPAVVALADRVADDSLAYVTAFERAFRHWVRVPPSVLKNDYSRLAKAAVRALAKTLGEPAELVDLIARQAIGLGLLLTNEMSRSGRGRNQVVELAWLPDQPVVAAWYAMGARKQWTALVADWCRGGMGPQRPNWQAMSVRHLVLWELLGLAPNQGYSTVAEFTAWITDRYSPVANPDLVNDAVTDLRHLGLLRSDAVALTQVGRQTLVDPTAPVDDGGDAWATSFVVQGDMTVIVPPDLAPDVRIRLAAIATQDGPPEALMYRLDERRITAALGDETADTLVEFLTSSSSTPVPDGIVRMFHDLARERRTARVIAAATVVVFDNAADLAVGVALKKLQLRPVTETVAVTTIDVAKVAAALSAKGISAGMPATEGTTRPGRSVVDRASAASRLLDQYRSEHARAATPAMAAEIARLERMAAAAGDLTGRFAVVGSLTLNPAALAGNGSKRR